jgi:two-component system LytT family response regulator
MMQCIAIDDEPLALAQIKDYITKTPFLRLAAAYVSAIDSIPVLAEDAIDLLFVDINMPDMNGLDFVRSIRHKPLVIFTTAHSEYALDGFRVDAFDYLLKPVGYPDFLRSAEKAFRQYNLLKKGNEAPPDTESERFFVKSEYKLVPVEIAAISYIESRSEYLRIYCENSPPIMTLGNMKSIEDKLPSDRFMRIHRSYIINLQKITTVERSHILLSGNIRIPIGEQYKDVFRDYIAKYSL